MYIILSYTEHLHLRRIPYLSQKYECHSGFSDHSVGCDAAVTAVSMGACIVEKHFTLDRNLDGLIIGFLLPLKSFPNLFLGLEMSKK